MQLEISTPALLFPAVSLLFLAFTNRFLHLAALIRHLHGDWVQHRDASVLAQIANIRRRLAIIRWMQLAGALSLLLCVVSMVAVTCAAHLVAIISFVAALVAMASSLVALIIEIYVSGGALAILLSQMGEHRAPGGAAAKEDRAPGGAAANHESGRVGAGDARGGQR